MNNKEFVDLHMASGKTIRVGISDMETNGMIDESETTGEALLNVEKAIQMRNHLLTSEGMQILVTGRVEAYEFVR